MEVLTILSLRILAGGDFVDRNPDCDDLSLIILTSVYSRFWQFKKKISFAAASRAPLGIGVSNFIQVLLRDDRNPEYC